MAGTDFQAKWHQVKGVVKELWGEITGDELEFVDGQRDRLIGKLQEKYGYSEEEAARKVDEMMEKH